LCSIDHAEIRSKKALRSILSDFLVTAIFSIPVSWQLLSEGSTACKAVASAAGSLDRMNPVLAAATKTRFQAT